MSDIDRGRTLSKASVGSHCQTKLDQLLKGRGAKSAYPLIFYRVVLSVLNLLFSS